MYWGFSRCHATLELALLFEAINLLSSFVEVPFVENKIKVEYLSSFSWKCHSSNWNRKSFSIIEVPLVEIPNYNFMFFRILISYSIPNFDLMFLHRRWSHNTAHFMFWDRYWSHITKFPFRVFWWISILYWIFAGTYSTDFQNVSARVVSDLLKVSISRFLVSVNSISKNDQLGLELF